MWGSADRATGAWLAAQIEEASAAGIAATVSRLIRDGTLSAESVFMKTAK